MTLYLNKQIVAGNVGKTPEIRKTQSGIDVASFSVAVNEKYTDKQTGEVKENTDWINVVVFGSLVNSVIAKYVKKGTPVYIEGKSKTRSYEKNGEKKYVTELVVSGFDSVFRLTGSKVETNEKMSDNVNESSNDIEEDEIPF